MAEQVKKEEEISLSEIHLHFCNQLEALFYYLNNFKEGNEKEVWNKLNGTNQAQEQLNLNGWVLRLSEKFEEVKDPNFLKNHYEFQQFKANALLNFSVRDCFNLDMYVKSLMYFENMLFDLLYRQNLTSNGDANHLRHIFIGEINEVFMGKKEEFSPGYFSKNYTRLQLANAVKWINTYANTIITQYNEEFLELLNLMDKFFKGELEAGVFVYTMKQQISELVDRFNLIPGRRSDKKYVILSPLDKKLSLMPRFDNRKFFVFYILPLIETISLKGLLSEVQLRIMNNYSESWQKAVGIHVEKVCIPFEMEDQDNKLDEMCNAYIRCSQEFSSLFSDSVLPVNFSDAVNKLYEVLGEIVDKAGEFIYEKFEHEGAFDPFIVWAVEILNKPKTISPYCKEDFQLIKNIALSLGSFLFAAHMNPSEDFLNAYKEFDVDDKKACRFVNQRTVATLQQYIAKLERYVGLCDTPKHDAVRRYVDEISRLLEEFSDVADAINGYFTPEQVLSLKEKAIKITLLKDSAMNVDGNFERDTLAFYAYADNFCKRLKKLSSNGNSSRERQKTISFSAERLKNHFHKIVEKQEGAFSPQKAKSNDLEISIGGKILDPDLTHLEQYLSSLSKNVALMKNFRPEELLEKKAVFLNVVAHLVRIINYVKSQWAKNNISSWELLHNQYHLDEYKSLLKREIFQDQLLEIHLGLIDIVMNVCKLLRDAHVVYSDEMQHSEFGEPNDDEVDESFHPSAPISGHRSTSLLGSASAAVLTTPWESSKSSIKRSASANSSNSGGIAISFGSSPLLGQSYKDNKVLADPKQILQDIINLLQPQITEISLTNVADALRGIPGSDKQFPAIGLADLFKALADGRAERKKQLADIGIDIGEQEKLKLEILELKKQQADQKEELEKREARLKQDEEDNKECRAEYGRKSITLHADYTTKAERLKQREEAVAKKESEHDEANKTVMQLKEKLQATQESEKQLKLVAEAFYLHRKNAEDMTWIKYQGLMRFGYVDPLSMLVWDNYHEYESYYHAVERYIKALSTNINSTYEMDVEDSALKKEIQSIGSVIVDKNQFLLSTAFIIQLWKSIVADISACKRSQARTPVKSKEAASASGTATQSYGFDLQKIQNNFSLLLSTVERFFETVFKLDYLADCEVLFDCSLSSAVLAQEMTEAERKKWAAEVHLSKLADKKENDSVKVAAKAEIKKIKTLIEDIWERQEIYSKQIEALRKLRKSQPFVAKLIVVWLQILLLEIKQTNLEELPMSSFKDEVDRLFLIHMIIDHLPLKNDPMFLSQIINCLDQDMFMSLFRFVVDIRFFSQMTSKQIHGLSKLDLKSIYAQNVLKLACAISEDRLVSILLNNCDIDAAVRRALETVLNDPTVESDHFISRLLSSMHSQLGALPAQPNLDNAQPAVLINRWLSFCMNIFLYDIDGLGFPRPVKQKIENIRRAAVFFVNKCKMLDVSFIPLSFDIQPYMTARLRDKSHQEARTKPCFNNKFVVWNEGQAIIPSLYGTDKNQQDVSRDFMTFMIIEKAMGGMIASTIMSADKYQSIMECSFQMLALTKAGKQYYPRSFSHFVNMARKLLVKRPLEMNHPSDMGQVDKYASFVCEIFRFGIDGGKSRPLFVENLELYLKRYFHFMNKLQVVKDHPAERLLLDLTARYADFLFYELSRFNFTNPDPFIRSEHGNLVINCFKWLVQKLAPSKASQIQECSPTLRTPYVFGKIFTSLLMHCHSLLTDASLLDLSNFLTDRKQTIVGFLAHDDKLAAEFNTSSMEKHKDVDYRSIVLCWYQTIVQFFMQGGDNLQENLNNTVKLFKRILQQCNGKTEWTIGACQYMFNKLKLNVEEKGWDLMKFRQALNIGFGESSIKKWLSAQPINTSSASNSSSSSASNSPSSPAAAM